MLRDLFVVEKSEQVCLFFCLFINFVDKQSCPLFYPRQVHRTFVCDDVIPMVCVLCATNQKIEVTT